MFERDWLGFTCVWQKSLDDWEHWILGLNTTWFPCTLTIVKKRPGGTFCGQWLCDWLLCSAIYDCVHWDPLRTAICSFELAKQCFTIELSSEQSSKTSLLWLWWPPQQKTAIRRRRAALWLMLQRWICKREPESWVMWLQPVQWVSGMPKTTISSLLFHRRTQSFYGEYSWRRCELKWQKFCRPESTHDGYSSWPETGTT